MDRILPIEPRVALTPPDPHHPMTPSRRTKRPGASRKDTETSGTFTSSARSITFLSWEIPRSAIQIAHENAADAGLPNIEATSVKATDWGWFDWILEIVGTRSARVTGTWGHR